MPSHELRIVLVVLLCVPVAYVGYRFCSSLLGNALAGKKKKGGGE